MARVYEKHLDDLQVGYFRPVEAKLERLGESGNETEITPISLKPAMIAKILGVAAFALMTVSVVSEVAYFLSGNSSAFFQKLVKAFSVDLELNVPNFFSTLILLCASALLWFITILKRKQKDSYVWHWAILAGGFLFMAFDEIVSAHEKLIEPMQAMLGRENLGVLYFAWVVPVGFIVLFLAGIFFRFWLNLPSKPRISFLIAGLLYVGGAIGMELVGGKYFEAHGGDNLVYIGLTAIEESLELAGVIVFIWALLEYISDNYTEVSVRFRTYWKEIEARETYLN